MYYSGFGPPSQGDCNEPSSGEDNLLPVLTVSSPCDITPMSRTVQTMGITVFGSLHNSNVPVAMAGILLASIPMLVLYLAGEQHSIRGGLAGAIKGWR